MSDAPHVRRAPCPTRSVSDAPHVRRAPCPTRPMSDALRVRRASCPTFLHVTGRVSEGRSHCEIIPYENPPVLACCPELLQASLPDASRPSGIRLSSDHLQTSTENAHADEFAVSPTERRTFQRRAEEIRNEVLRAQVNRNLHPCSRPPRLYGIHGSRPTVLS